MSHTPGPWFAKLGEFDYGNDGSRRVMHGDENLSHYGRICTVDTKADRIERGKNKTPYNAPDGERDANARLIAAAPDLLEALEKVLQGGEEDAGNGYVERLRRNHRVPRIGTAFRESVERARAAIKKARGQ